MTASINGAQSADNYASTGASVQDKRRSSGECGLSLGDKSQLKPHEFLGMDAERRTTRKYSLVFLNACQTGAAGETLGLVSGFPGVLARSGAGAVIAPLWEVGDTSARAFAEAFYDMTFSNQMRAGVALRNLRGGKGASESIDRFAYIFYGHPSLMFKLD